MKCPPGKVQKDMGKTSWIECKKGEYNEKAGKKECSKCKRGTANPLPGQMKKESCIICPPGAESNKDLTECTACPSGKSNAKAGNIEGCKKCYYGRWSERDPKSKVGPTKCLQCESTF